MGNKDDSHPCKKLAKLTALIILFFTAYLLGYSSHNQTLTPNPQPTSVSNINDDHQDFSYIKCADPVATGTERQIILDKVFSGPSPWENFPPPHMAPHLRRDWTIWGGMGSNNQVFERLITQFKPKIIIEAGSFLGASATHMARIARKLDLDTLIICLDDFRSWPLHPPIKMINGDSILLYQFMVNVETANATENIIFLPFSTTNGFDGLCTWGIFADMVEIDAAHDFHSAWNDINNGFKVLRPGGVLFGHDIAIDGVKRAVELFCCTPWISSES